MPASNTSPQSVRMPLVSVVAASGSTADRILRSAVSSFAGKGFEATSLDGLARSLGITKQTILHHYGSKELLLDATISHVAAVLAETVEGALAGRDTATAWSRLERVIRAMFSLTSQNPELVGLVREISRLGSPAIDRLTHALEPLTDRASSFVRGTMVEPATRARDPRYIVTSAYAAVIAAFVEVEVLTSLGQRPSPRLLLRRRRELLGYLADMLGVPR